MVGRMRALIVVFQARTGPIWRGCFKKGYEVLARRAMRRSVDSIFVAARGPRQVRLESMASNDFRSVLNVVRRTNPDEIYNLAGQSSVGLSFEQPVETLESIAFGTINLVGGRTFFDRPIRFYSAGSSECFGDT